MNTAHINAEPGPHDAEMQAQLCAYNAAFEELGLRFRWDAHTLASLAMIDGEKAQIAAYIEAHHGHLLKAYSAEFLSRAILDRKSARCAAPLRGSFASAPRSTDVAHQTASGRRERVSFEVELPALAGV